MRELLVVAAISTPFLLGASLAADRDGDALFHFTDPAILESSGLVAVDGRVITVNDSGDVGRVFTVDPATGNTVGVTRWIPEPEDIEALAPAGPGQVWVGDVGDNQRQRESVSVYRVPVGPGDRLVEIEVFELELPEPADVEAMLADPATGRLYLVTKSIAGGVVLAAPTTLDPDQRNKLEPVGQVAGLITDGSFFPDGRHVVLRNYTMAFVYTFPEFELVESFRLPNQRQGEGIAVTPDERILISSEGANAPVLEVVLPEALRAAIAPKGDPGGVATASPGESEAPLEAGDPEAAGEPRKSDAPWWPWLAGGGAVLLILVVLLRNLRSR